MAICAISIDDKRAFGKAVGEELVRRHGKQPYYTVPQVRAAARARKYPVDWDCWAMSLYTAPPEFFGYHQSIGESCDYAAMKSEMVATMTNGASSSWFEVDMSWLDWPDIDLGSIFDVF
jgi:hypothetical protein